MIEIIYKYSVTVLGNLTILFILWAGFREALGWFCDLIRDVSYNRQLPRLRFGKSLTIPYSWTKGKMKIWGVNLGMFVFGVTQYLPDKKD